MLDDLDRRDQVELLGLDPTEFDDDTDKSGKGSHFVFLEDLVASNLTLKLVVDDGAAVFLNGSPIANVHLNSGAAYNTLATAMPNLSLATGSSVMRLVSCGMSSPTSHMPAIRG